MIDGLKIKIPSSELGEHMRSRADYYEGRAATKLAELPKIREAIEAMKASLQQPDAAAHMFKGVNSNGYNMNPQDTIENLERDIRDHQNKAVAYRYLADHLFDDDYDLSESDLKRLEILK